MVLLLLTIGLQIILAACLYSLLAQMVLSRADGVLAAFLEALRYLARSLRLC